MTPVGWAILLFGLAALLIVAELFLPSHGVLTGMAVLCLIGGVAASYMIRPWLGVASLAVSAGAGALLGRWFVNHWPKTRAGRKMVLHDDRQPPPPLEVQIGQEGMTSSELRPTGICEFSGQRVEVTSDLGLIPRGRAVQVVDIVNRRPIVREAPVTRQV